VRTKFEIFCEHDIILVCVMSNYFLILLTYDVCYVHNFQKLALC
jgi:hypothetical protein